ncbi:hypothetical protein NQ024_14150, partial [Corynebacterium sp. 35RC1]|nr:hypothetical protein [Corynebacterium sp. 35RC1]
MAMDFRRASIRSVILLGAAALLAACGGGGGADTAAAAAAPATAAARAVVWSVDALEQPATAAQDTVRVKDLG